MKSKTLSAPLKRAIYAGSFDPFTFGHQNIVERALELFDEVVILLAVSPTKQPLLPVEERREAIMGHFKREPRVVVDVGDGLVVEYARKKKISHIIRGLRPTGDFDIEFQMASMNHELNPKIDTVFFMTDKEHFFISSSLVREIFHHGGDIGPFVPASILKRMQKK